MKCIRRLIVNAFIVVILSSCVASNTMYYWGKVSLSDKITQYEKVTYNYYKSKSPKSICEMIETYHDIIVKCKDNEKMIPPGICAELGYILLNHENEACFNTYASKSQKKKMEGVIFFEYGKELMEKEMSLYPESRHFLEPVIERLANEKEEVGL